MKTVILSEHKEYEILHIEIDGVTFFHANQRDLTSLNLASMLKAVGCNVELREYKAE